jgi:hypothetical protein
VHKYIEFVELHKIILLFVRKVKLNNKGFLYYMVFMEYVMGRRTSLV